VRTTSSAGPLAQAADGAWCRWSCSRLAGTGSAGRSPTPIGPANGGPSPASSCFDNRW